MQTNLESTQTPTSAPSVLALQACYRQELSARETYEIALKSVGHIGVHRALQEILDSHAECETRIAARIRDVGGQLPPSSGARGVFAKALQAGADLLGDHITVAALERGEDGTLALYSEGMGACDAATRAFVSTELLPRAQHTHALCRTLESYTATPS
jgi:hypothetical protein